MTIAINWKIQDTQIEIAETYNNKWPVVVTQRLTGLKPSIPHDWLVARQTEFHLQDLVKTAKEINKLQIKSKTDAEAHLTTLKKKLAPIIENDTNVTDYKIIESAMNKCRKIRDSEKNDSKASG